MKATFLFFVAILFLQDRLYAQQKQAAVWRYAVGNELNFNTMPFTHSYRPNTGTGAGIAAICDSTGVLQFYCNGANIFNKQDGLIVALDGGTIGHGYGYGCDIIIPTFSYPKLYHYFNVRSHAGDFRLYRFLINMELNGGLGGMESQKTKIIEGSLGTQLACALHANGRDTWLIGRKGNQDSLIAWLVQDTAITKRVVSKLGSPVLVPNLTQSDSRGGWDSQIKTSPNSEMLLIPRRTVQFSFHELYRFNRETGQVHSRVVIRDTTKSGNFYINSYPDGAFSPDSKTLYTGTGTRNQETVLIEGPATFWQYNLEVYDSLAIAQSKQYLGRLGRANPAKQEPRMFSPHFQLAIDGKIYVSHGSIQDSLLSRIHCPDTKGANCGLKFREINLKKGRNGYFFPTLNQTFVRNAGIFQVQANKRSLCQGDTLELSAYGAGAEHFTWSVSPTLPQGVKVDTLTWQKISTQKIPPGSYTFRCVGTSRCGDVFDKNMVVHVRPNPLKPVITGSPPPWGEAGWGLCTGDSVTLSVPDTSARYQWSTGDTTASIRILPWNASGTRWFTLVTQNQYGCQSPPSDSVAVTMKDVFPTTHPVIISRPSMNTDSGTVALCAGDTLQATATGAETYRWSDGNTNPSRKLTGSGSLVLYGYDTSGCVAKAETELRYTTVANPTPRFINPDSVLTRETLANRNYCVAGQPGSRFSFTVTGGEKVDSSENCVTVQWAVDSRQWTVFAMERFSNPPCTGSATQRFTYQPNLSVPNLITPNGDGKNDVFRIEDLEFYPSHHLQIFNRWGKKVVDTQDYRQDWMGEAGMYFYRLSLESQKFTGWVEVVK